MTPIWKKFLKSLTPFLKKFTPFLKKFVVACINLKIISYLCIVHISLWRYDGDSDILKATLTLVFGDLNYHNQISIKDMQRWRLRVYVYSRGCAEGTCALTHTFRVYYILTSVGIDSVRSIEEAVVGLSHGMGRWRYPAFVWSLSKCLFTFWLGVSVGAFATE